MQYSDYVAYKKDLDRLNDDDLIEVLRQSKQLLVGRRAYKTNVKDALRKHGFTFDSNSVVTKPDGKWASGVWRDPAGNAFTIEYSVTIAVNEDGYPVKVNRITAS